MLTQKLYKDQMLDEEGNSSFSENLSEFLESSITFFEEFVQSK